MKRVLACLSNVRGGNVKKQVEKRLAEFKIVGRGTGNSIFSEACFCILTANYNALGGIRIQKAIGDGFLKLSEKELAMELKKLGHRFPNTRAKYILEARKHAKDIKERIVSFKDHDARRKWVVDNIKGLGYKEASHFLRNIGFEDYAIIDFHIIDFLEGYGLIKKPKTITPARYLEIEQVLRDVAKASGMNLAELDLYMWYCETGKILK